MSETIFTVVISYDISRAATRRRVAKKLEKNMVRVQQSVFEARLKLAAARQAFGEIENMIDDHDSVRMYVLTKTGLEHSCVAGGTSIQEEEGYWLF